MVFTAETGWLWEVDAYYFLYRRTTKSLTLEKHQRVVKESLESSKSSESYHRVPRVIEKSPELEPSKCPQSHQSVTKVIRLSSVIRDMRE